MENIYDNGSLVLGNIDNVLEYIMKSNKEDIYNIEIDIEELTKDLKELKQENDNIIVCINYDYGYKYVLDYWTDKDIIK